jgi:murein DD-endopeptidase MepM/ murein hydrolase activator NlpD
MRAQFLTTPPWPSRLRVALVASLVGGAVAALGGSLAGAQDLQSKVDEKQTELSEAQEKKGALSTEISAYDDKIADLTGEVAALRNREAQVEAELEEAQNQLEIERENLQVMRQRLEREIKVLRERLVAIYKTGEPDALTVVLESDGFDDILERYEYLERIQSQDSNIVGSVRVLRNEAKSTVDRITAVRDRIAAKERELERTRVALEQREAELEAARADSATLLKKTNGQIDRLEGDIGDLEQEIQQQLAAASGTTPLPAGPVRQGSGSMIWPVDGTVTSPFGPRWGRMHNGIDIAASSGTPIRAVDDGSIALVQSEAESGGYGNFTCVDHGGGLASCYAHQSSMAITSGSVSQGDIIGYVGCTGSCYGDHLHFEIRVNGVATDPLAYL